jgi:DNA polymerase-4
MTLLCRDCFNTFAEAPAGGRCATCGGRRLVNHAELARLSIAHIDCDAFYASIEKRDDPGLRDKPVIVGGGRRGVVAAACYVARLYGVRSAMPMFKALKACPDAVVIPPDMRKYSDVGRQVRALMQATTPVVEPLSIDEAFLDLSGTERLHGGSPAQTLARLAKRVESELELTVSVGLSYNKFLAKIASDLDKPRGFAVIGRDEAEDFLAGQPVSILWGVGKALQRSLERDGIRRVGDLLAYDEGELVARYGAIGRRLHRFARGRDERSVDPVAPAKSVSAETTFERDIAGLDDLSALLWPLCEKVSRRLKRAELAGHGVTLKLKTAEFRQLTRSRRLSDPTQLAEVLYRVGRDLLAGEADGRRFRLIGIGVTDLEAGADADPPNLLDPDSSHRAEVERAIDSVRAKLGEAAISKGRGLAAQGGSAQQPTARRRDGAPRRGPGSQPGGSKRR